MALAAMAGACSLLLPDGPPSDGGVDDADMADDGDADDGADGASDGDAVDAADGDAPGDADADGGRICRSWADCDDGNTCTWDQCVGRRCDNQIPTEASLALLNASGMVATLRVGLGGTGLSVEDITCSSIFEGEVLFGHDFDDGALGPFLAAPDAVVMAEADVHAAPLGQGVRLCSATSSISTERIDLSALTGGTVVLRFALDGSPLPAGSFLSARISSDDGSRYPAVAIAGDGTAVAAGWESFEVMLPPSYLTEDRVRLMLTRVGGAGGHCGDVDEVSLVRLGPSDIEVRLSENFDSGGLGSLVASGPVGDVMVRTDSSGTFVRLTDRNGAALTATVDTTGLEPGDRAVFAWRWQHSGSSLHATGEYVLVQWSADGGTSWTQLAGTGNLASPEDFIDMAAVLPAEALDVTDLQIRFIAPTTSDLGATDGVDIDDVVFSLQRRREVDGFDPFEDQGGGAYRTRLRTLQTGRRAVSCQWQCGGDLLETEAVSFEL